MQRFERRDLFGQQSNTARNAPALIVDVRAKTPDTVAAEAQIDRSALFLVELHVEFGQLLPQGKVIEEVNPILRGWVKLTDTTCAPADT